jgi:class 3 adenylate cyclase/DNA-binding CsgD family transcriptional regulator
MSAEASDEPLCILVTDLVGWTELGDRLGAEAAHLLRRDHFVAVRAALGVHRGREVTTAGESFIATFRGGSDAVRCAVAIQEAAASTPLTVRVGVHAGELVTGEVDEPGTPVNLAARLCAAAGPGGVLLSEPIRSLLGPHGGSALEDAGLFPAANHGEGPHEPVRAFRIRGGQVVSSSRLPPVAARQPVRPPTAVLQRTERSLLCPDLIERERESGVLRSALDRLGRAEGGVAVLVGEAGVGKTRLARETLTSARAGGLTVLSGRAVPGASPVPYRPLTEAFLSAFRTTRPTEAPGLAGFGGQLARLVPAWGTGGGGGADESPVLLGEAVVRLLRLVGAGRGSVLVLEDLHWADSETLAVVEYLADALRGQPSLCLCTARPEGAAVSVLSRLRRSEGVTVLGLDRLSRAGVERAVASCLSGGGVPDAAVLSCAAPADVLECVAANSEGNPFLVEELLAGLVTSGALRLADGRWQSTGRLAPSVPFDFGESVRNRLWALDDIARRVVRAAALLGRRFDWELLPGLAEVDARAVVDALRLTVDAQIVEVDGNDFRFRHALTREAVLAELLPPERCALARRALPAVERAHPGLPGAWCELVAELAVEAGDDESAARHLTESARRALAGGALASAEAIAARARRLAADAGPAGSELIDDVDDVLLRVLTLAGKPVEAAAVGDALVERLSRHEPDASDNGDTGAADRLADVLVVLARAAITAGEVERAGTLVERAQRLLADGALAAALAARVEAVAAHVALEQGRLVEAGNLGHAAADHAASTWQPAVQCEALEVLGRVDRARDGSSTGSTGGFDFFERGMALAEQHGLTTWLLRVRHEMAMLTTVTTGDRRPMIEVRELAAANGALVTVAVMDLVMADVALASFDRVASLDHAHRAVDASRPYRLATLPVANLWLAGAHALAGDAEATEAVATQALEPDLDDPRILGDLWGRVRATLAVVRDDPKGLRHALDMMMTYVRVAPVTTSIFLNRVLWALVHTVSDDDHGVAARAEVAAATHLRSLPAFVHLSALAEAVAAGRRGDPEEAAARYAAAPSGPAQRLIPGTVHYAHLLAAEAAVRDGWGEPIGWLRRAEAFFADGGYDRVARRCRSALAAAGAPVPRRGRGSAVPPGLRAIGITSRELDVLGLVAEGLSNRQIAERLFLSPKTVERHLSSLFDRTGVRERGALGDFARQYG